MTSDESGLLSPQFPKLMSISRSPLTSYDDEASRQISGQGPASPFTCDNICKSSAITSFRDGGPGRGSNAGVSVDDIGKQVALAPHTARAPFSSRDAIL